MNSNFEIRPFVDKKLPPLVKPKHFLRPILDVTNLIKPPTIPFIRQTLLSKITFNLSRGHFSFVYELLKSKQANNMVSMKEVNANELVAGSEVWLQLETSQQNKKFLNGKTPLILSSYIKVNILQSALVNL